MGFAIRQSEVAWDWYSHQNVEALNVDFQCLNTHPRPQMSQRQSQDLLILHASIATDAALRSKDDLRERDVIEIYYKQKSYCEMNLEVSTLVQTNVISYRLETSSCLCARLRSSGTDSQARAKSLVDEAMCSMASMATRVSTLHDWKFKLRSLMNQ